MLHATHHVSGGVLWANLHLLFWLSLIPFVTGWMGENHFAAVPTAMYGVILLMSALAYFILQRVILAANGKDSILAKAVGKDWKAMISPVLYICGIIFAFYMEWMAGFFYAFVALMWLVPERRIEKALSGH